MSATKMKPTCNKVKNPCKFCLQQVTPKNGLQCQGACKKWAHYKCLNYTPGKISDIKAGIIKVTCPCPDCETTQPKEFLTNPPYTCSNHQCPANKAPKCESYECPTNKNRGWTPPAAPIADYPVNNNKCPNAGCTNEPMPCPAVECPNSAPPQLQERSHPRMSPPRPPTPPRAVPRGRPPQGGSPCQNLPKKPCPDQKKQPPKNIPKNPVKPCPNQCDKDRKKKPQPVQKSPSCSILSSDTSACNNKTASSSSDSNVGGSPKRRASMVQALQEMCTTVGKLSVQLKELMCKMMQNVS